MFRLGLAAALLVACSGQRALKCPTSEPTKNSLEEEKQYDYYDVSAPDPPTFNKNAHAKRPFNIGMADAEGLTESQFCFEFMYRSDEKECRLDVVRLRHNVRITLSRWIDVPAKYADWYRKSSARLAAHEERHYAIGVAVAHEYYDAILAVTAEPTCEALTAKVNGIGTKYGDELKRRNFDFDREDYGKTGLEDMTAP